MPDSHEVVARTLLRAALSRRAAFRTWTGAVDAAAALLFIHKYEAADAATRPLAWLGELAASNDQVALGYAPLAGTIELVFEAQISGDDMTEGVLDDVDATYDAFNNSVGAIVNALQVPDGGDELRNLEIRTDGPIRIGSVAEMREGNTYIQRSFEVSFGSTGASE